MGLDKLDLLPLVQMISKNELFLFLWGLCKTLLIETLLLEKILVTSDKTPYLSFTLSLMYEVKNRSIILPLKYLFLLLFDKAKGNLILPLNIEEISDINADVVAGEVAQSLKAEKLILLTDVKGIGDSKNKLISKLSLQKGQRILKEKFIKGGMTPKLTAALEAKKRGVKSCHIIDGIKPKHWIF